MLSSDKLPNHVGIIMDGNGRWASMRRLPRAEGHRKGAERAKEIIGVSREMGIRYLTLYTFSMENWQRPKDEVSTLMKLLEMYLRKECNKLVRDGVVFRSIGEIGRLPQNIQTLLEELEEKTTHNTGMTLLAALSYGGRDEILRAVRKAIHTGMTSSEITEKSFSNLLDTNGIPPPDLIIRTSGERRLSNFLLWQSAYSELYFTETLWPDFTKDEYLHALSDFQFRERRFGSVPLRQA
ncbi:MAG: isoprenyl transferase [Nitrospirae bacterium]|nr:isoprenyl transferase [Nitrospirota bacterium]